MGHLTERGSVLQKGKEKVEGLVGLKGKGMVLKKGWNSAEKLAGT